MYCLATFISLVRVLTPPPPLHEVQVGEAGFSDGDILMFVCLFGLSSIAWNSSQVAQAQILTPCKIHTP